MGHASHVDVIGFVLCCRFGREKIDHGGVGCMCVWEEVWLRDGYFRNGTGWKGRALR